MCAGAAAADLDYLTRIRTATAVVRDEYILYLGRIGSPKKIRDLRDQVEECYGTEGQPTENIPVGVLRFHGISEDRTEIERYIVGARYQRVSLSLKTRQKIFPTII